MPLITVDQSSTGLVDFLSKFPQILKPVTGDLAAISRLTSEAVQDLWEEGHV